MLSVAAFFYVSHIKAGKLCLHIDVAFIEIIHFEKSLYRTAGLPGPSYMKMRDPFIIGFLRGKISISRIQKTVMNSQGNRLTIIDIGDLAVAEKE